MYFSSVKILSPVVIEFVEYALKQSMAPIGVATYKLSSNLPENMKAMLPDPAVIAARLAVFEDNLEF